MANTNFNIWEAMGREQRRENLASFMVPSLTNQRKDDPIKKDPPVAEKDTKPE